MQEVQSFEGNSIALIGKPNSGKTLLFNRLTGLKQKVANYPGITTDIKVGIFDGHEVVDMPGIYTLDPLTADEAVTVEQLEKLIAGGRMSLLLFVLEATNLSASLAIVLQTFEKLKDKMPRAIIALNMMDEAIKHGIEIDHAGLANELGIELIPISSKTGQGINLLKERIHKAIGSGANKQPAKGNSNSDDLANRFRKEKTSFYLNQLRIDKFFLSPVLGGVLFFALMLVLFQSIFTWAAPFMDAMEAVVIFASDFVTSRMSEGPVRDFVADGLFAGMGSFVVFVPQIFVLTFLVGLLEDSGYLARAALITHKPLSFFGLSGKSFIPYLTGHACAIPAIYASRTIESPIKRLLTQLTVPLMSCSARLPVYGLLVAAVIPPKTILGGVFGLQGLVFFLIYALGIITALLVSLLTKPLFKKQLSDTPLILEMPPYRLPSLNSLMRKAFEASKKFVVKAGPIIFAVSVVIWFLGYFPQNDEGLAGSYLGRFGHFIEPVFAVIDVNWKYAVAILTSFLAREVFVGTLGTLFGIESADENVESLISQVRDSGLTLPSGLALLVFFAIALQCVSTVAVLQQELKSKLTPWLAFAFYGVLAYGMSVVTFYVASALI
jgi:ferrous iron transport protein B